MNTFLLMKLVPLITGCRLNITRVFTVQYYNIWTRNSERVLKNKTMREKLKGKERDNPHLIEMLGTVKLLWGIIAKSMFMNMNTNLPFLACFYCPCAVTCHSSQLSRGLPDTDRISRSSPVRVTKPPGRFLEKFWLFDAFFRWLNRRSSCFGPVTLVRAQNRTARSWVQRANHKATAPSYSSQLRRQNDPLKSTRLAEF